MCEHQSLPPAPGNPNLTVDDGPSTIENTPKSESSLALVVVRRHCSKVAYQNDGINDDEYRRIGENTTYERARR